MMDHAFAPIAETRGIGIKRFHEQIVPAHKPLVLRGAATDWPAVAAGRNSPHAMRAYLERFDAGVKIPMIIGAPDIKGLFFYRENVRGQNFATQQCGLPTALDRMFAQIDSDAPEAVAVQSVPVLDLLPGFERQNKLPLTPDGAAPRAWIGTPACVQTHCDRSENIAVVVAGRRRFTLFPPEQIGNLYIGPIDYTPGGTPVSLASLDEPDFEKFPRLKEALASAQTAELEPGDAIFIPYGWWHHVVALSPFNMLVNYWWKCPDIQATATDVLVHAWLAVRPMPEHQRKVWRAMFDHYIFGEDDPVEHIPEHSRGVFGELSPQTAKQLRSVLRAKLNH